MTPAAILAQMIEELPPQDKEKAEEYIYFLHSKLPSVNTELDAKYREYILQGIREGEEDFANGDVLDSVEAAKYLKELLNDESKVIAR
jgi:hypothetical protein